MPDDRSGLGIPNLGRPPFVGVVVQSDGLPHHYPDASFHHEGNGLILMVTRSGHPIATYRDWDWAQKEGSE